MTPDTSFRAYLAQSSTAQTIRSNRKLWKLNLFLLFAGLIAFGAACTSATPAADEPISRGTSAQELVDAMGPAWRAEFCEAYLAAVDAGMQAIAFEYFAEGYGNQQHPTANELWFSAASRCTD